MELSDIAHLAPAEWQLKELRERLIDQYVDTMSWSELEAVQELVAREHEAHAPWLGAIVRQGNPRAAPAVRAKIFAMLPKPTAPALSAGTSEPAPRALPAPPLSSLSPSSSTGGS